MPLVVIQTTLPGTASRPFRITEVLDKVADSAEEALEAALVHIGGDREATSDYLTARWHKSGGYWVVAYDPVPEAVAGAAVAVM
ncbi:hypothetical protein [Magnetospirillum sp. UT-4]|uniref:hypothetical protein n=1 Tax=Magnetospirillum sp. UT-4 TaxID=2681467 RepID=UPI001383825B|nr:hypothetical protein [Magnetospirillum sp. UT-4]CAA7618083.1 hypothetical protein MTBUT4_280036 [Magnetospirillum sp. UT-4]